MTAAIEIYTRPGCGYCSAAKSLLTRKNAAFTEFDVARDPTLRQVMWNRAGAGSTFPQIFIGQTHVGGCDELYALDRAGKLERVAGGRKGQFMSADLTFTAAMVQMRTSLLPEPSLEQGIKLIRQAAADGADYVLTPEVSNMMQLNRKALFEHLAAEEDDVSLKAYRALAAELKIHLHIGSLALRASPERAVNRSFLIGPDGLIIASYDKIHMFDIDLPGGESYRESANYQPGETAVISDLPWGRIGLTICYDVRFPALYRALAESGAAFLTVPSAFTRKTGEAHWHTLLRARAIENGCFVFAAAQAGLHENKRETYGHSLIIAPWGEVLAEGGVEPGVFMARIDPSLVETARKTVPSLQHGRRFSVVDPKSGPEHLHLVRGSA